MIEGITLGELIIAGGSLIAIWRIFDFIYQKVFKPHNDISNDIKEIKAEVKAIKEKQDRDYKVLQDHEKRIDNMEDVIKYLKEDREELHDTNKMLLEGMQALLGGDPQEIDEARRSIKKFFTHKAS